MAGKDPHSFIIENQTVKVFETFLQPAQKLPMHSHIPHLRYCFTEAHNKHTWRNGSTDVVVDKPGDWEVREQLEHEVENVGQTVIHSLIFEFKQPIGTSAEMKNYFSNSPTTLFDDCLMVADNAFVRAYQVKLRPNQKVKYRLKESLIYSFNGNLKLEVLTNDKTVVSSVAAKSAAWIDNNFVSFIGTGSEPADLVIMETKTALRAKL